METAEIVRLIREALPDAKIRVEDLVGDQDHFAAHVTSAAFVGKSRLEQHRMVLAALEGRVGGDLHALSIQTHPPEGERP